jgi:hypothetical protein
MCAKSLCVYQLLFAIESPFRWVNNDLPYVYLTDVPKFGEPISNVTVPVGREATLTCVVDDLATYKVNPTPIVSSSDN